MQYRRYNTVNNRSSDSSFPSDKSEDEISCKASNDKFTKDLPAGNRFFHRWFFNISDIPNALTNRFKDWLRAIPHDGSRGSTTDKSTGSESHLVTSTTQYNNYNRSKRYKQPAQFFFLNTSKM